MAEAHHLTDNILQHPTEHSSPVAQTKSEHAEAEEESNVAN